MKNKKYFLVKVLIVVMVSAFTLSSCTDNKAKIRSELNLGIKNLYKGDWTHAIEKFNSVIAMDSTQCEAHLYLGRAYFNQGKQDLAMQQYNTAIRLNPKYGEAYRSRAQLWFSLGNRTKSCKDYLKAEALGVKNLTNYTSHCK
ncbi:MAG: hypothetical protein DSY76_03925 [Bacteroidetes bacterium]|nr:MAG: hypothetical protein DSY76_03925 [Bacteroidota bacterium]